MTRCRNLIFGLLAALLYANVGGSQYSRNMFLNGQYKNGIRSSSAEHLSKNMFLEHAIISRQASPFQGPKYLPPEITCGSGQQCVRKEQCQSGYFSQKLPKIQQCDAETDVCCTYRAPATTPQPYDTCQPNFDCVQPTECNNGQIDSTNYIKKDGTSNRCYAPQVCCRMPTTILTESGYVINTPATPFTQPPPPQRPTTPRYVPITPQRPVNPPQRPTRPPVTPPNNQYLPPGSTPPPQRVTQPPYVPQRTPPPQVYTPPPRQPEQPQRTPPPQTYTPPPRQPEQPQRTPPPQTYTPPPRQPEQPQRTPPPQTYTPRQPEKPYSPPEQPPTYTYTPSPPQPPRTPARPYLPPPTPQPPRTPPKQTYTPAPPQPPQPPRTPEKPYVPPVAPQPPRTPPQTYPQPPQQPPRNPQQPYQPPQRQPSVNTPRPYNPPPQQPPRGTSPPRGNYNTPKPNQGYLPPVSENEIPDRVPESSNIKNIRGEDQLSPQIFPKPKFPPSQGGDFPQLPKHFAKCASALLCTQESYCNSIGVIVDQPVDISPASAAFRVPLTDCLMENGGEGKCCRDSNYVDPWPTNFQGVCGRRQRDTNPKGIRDIDTNFGEIPWQAMVLQESTKKLLAGGAIIGDRVVLTTASAVNGVSANDVRIKAGEWELGKTSEPLPFQLVGVQAIDIHPSYNPSTGANDMAIIRLDKRLEFATHIKPICISNEDPKPTEQCITSGWGRQALATHLEGAIMHQTLTTPVERSQCGADADSVCSTTKSDACEFDPGSALACGGSQDMLLKGIYSVENACGEGAVVRFIKPDVKWINTAVTEINKPSLIRRT